MIQVLEWSKEKSYKISLGKSQGIHIHFTDPPPKKTEIPIPEVPRNLLDFGPEINKNLKEKSPFQEGVISGAYQRPDHSYFQEPQELDSLINTGKLVQMFLLKQADIDNILKIIQRTVLKGTHLPAFVKEIQAGYLISPYFKDLYLYLAQHKLPSMKTAICKVETLAEKCILLDSLLLNWSLHQKRKQHY